MKNSLVKRIINHPFSRELVRAGNILVKSPKHYYMALATKAWLLGALACGEPTTGPGPGPLAAGSPDARR